MIQVARVERTLLFTNQGSFDRFNYNKDCLF